MKTEKPRDETKQRPCAWLPPVFIEAMPRMSETALRVGIALASYMSRRKPHCYPSYRRLMERMGRKGRGSLSKALAQLEALGVIQAEYRAGRVTTYAWVDDAPEPVPPSGTGVGVETKGEPVPPSGTGVAPVPRPTAAPPVPPSGTGVVPLSGTGHDKEVLKVRTEGRNLREETGTAAAAAPVLRRDELRPDKSREKGNGNPEKPPKKAPDPLPGAVVLLAQRAGLQVGQVQEAACAIGDLRAAAWVLTVLVRKERGRAKDPAALYASLWRKGNEPADVYLQEAKAILAAPRWWEAGARQDRGPERIGAVVARVEAGT